MGSPAESEGGGTIARAEGRYARLAQLEEQLQLSGGAEEKEQLDALLHALYLERTEGRPPAMMREALARLEQVGPKQPVWPPVLDAEELAVALGAQ